MKIMEKSQHSAALQTATAAFKAIVLVGIILLLLFAAMSNKHSSLFRFASPAETTGPGELAQWTPVRVMPLVDKSVTFRGYYEFPPLKKWPMVDDSKFRFVMTGKFVASNADARLIFFNQENYQRWVKREPPFPLASFKPMEPVHVDFIDMPGFVVIDPPAEVPGLDLSSVSAALLSLVRMQAAQQQVSQATIDLAVVTEAYITPSEAQAAVKESKNEH